MVNQHCSDLTSAQTIQHPTTQPTSRPDPAQRRPHAPAQFRLKNASSFSISKNPQASMAEVLAKAEKYINGEEALISKKESSSTHKEKSGTDKRRGRSPKRESVRERSPKKDEERSPKRRGNLRDRLGPPQFERRRRYSPQRFTPLIASVSQVLREVRNEQFLRWLTQMKSDPTTGITPSTVSSIGTTDTARTTAYNSRER